MNNQELMELAKRNEDACGQEVAQIMQKYGCRVHWQENWMDGQLVNRGIFFRFDPGLFMNPTNTN